MNLVKSNDNNEFTNVKDKHEHDIDIVITETGEDQLDESLKYPDGGRKAITVLIGCFCVLTGTLGITSSNGAIQNYISNNILPDISTSDSSWIFAGFNFTSFATNLLFSPLATQVNARIMLIGSFVIFGTGIMCLSVSTQLYQFILCYVLAGFGVCLGFTCSVNTVTHWFYKWRSTATGLAFMGSAAGGIIFPLMLQHLFPSVGFAWSIRILGFICMLLIGIGVFLVSDRRRELGLVGDNDGTNPITRAIKQINLYCLKDPVFATLVLGCIGSSGPYFLTTTYLISYATAHGWSPSLAYYLTIALNATSMIGRFGGGFLADKYGRINFFVISNLISCVSIFIFWLPTSIAKTKGGLFMFSILFGFTSGVYFQSSPTCVAQISKMEQFGQRYGTSSFIISLVNFALLPIGGLIVGRVDNTEGYDHLVIFIAIFQFVGLICISFCRYLYGGLKFVKI